MMTPEEKQQRARDLKAMASTPGWRHVLAWLDEHIRSSSDIRNLPMNEPDEKILQSLRLAQSRRDVYAGVKQFVQEEIRKGEANGR